MIPILDWIFEGIVNWVASVVSQLFDAVSGLFLEALGTDMTAMEEYLSLIHISVKKYVGVDFGAITDDAEAVAAAKAVGVELADAAEKTWGNALYACFDQKVEEHLVQPTFITMRCV